MNYCIQCKDATTGEVGSFGIDPKAEKKEGFKAITPVFPDLVAFFKWAKENNFKVEHQQEMA